MINGTGAPNPTAVGFTIDTTTLGDSYSLLPATFRTGLNPPAGTPEYLLSIDSPNPGVLQTAVIQPIRQGTAILAAVRAGVAAVRSWQRRSSASREDDDPLFVG
jgi:hypothetical protein